jgi:type I restriction enzyme M protein
LDGSARDPVISIFKADLQDRLDAEVAVGRRVLVDRYRTWADKYAVTLHALESQRAHAAARLNNYLKDLGYGSL